jgi:hypothetical protein
MGVLLAFFVGWAMGARGGDQQYDDVVKAARELRDSDEFATLVGALRIHAGYVLRQAADWLQETDVHATSGEFISRVREVVRPRGGDETG